MIVLGIDTRQQGREPVLGPYLDAAASRPEPRTTTDAALEPAFS